MKVKILLGKYPACATYKLILISFPKCNFNLKTITQSFPKWVRQWELLATIIFNNTSVYSASMKDYGDEFAKADPPGLLNIQWMFCMPAAY